MANEIEPIRIIDDCLNYANERFIANGKDWLRLYDEVFYPVTGVHPDVAEEIRNARHTHKILMKKIPANSQDFEDRLRGTKWLINHNYIIRKRNKWIVKKKKFEE